jgi:hypothetical protein
LSWKVWKQPLDRAREEFENGYRKGLNLSNWNGALTCFNSSYELYSKAGDQANARIAWTLATFSRALVEPQKIENWTDASNALKTLGLAEIDVTRTVPTEILAQECDLKALELRARTVIAPIERATQLEEVAKKYLAVGGRSLLVPLLIEKQQTSGQIRAHRIIAEAARLRGDEIVDLSPKNASEFYRMAAIHMKTAGDLESFRYLSGKADDFSTTARCYFCGREVPGKEVNFVHMKASLTRFLQKQNESQALPSILSIERVVACKGCHSAITIAADEIAKRYYDLIEAELQQFKQTVESEISNLKSKIGHLESRVR